ncbi:MAG: glutathione S-transferase [Parvibaculum sp.]|jgi:glutathione S-transferase|uniref:glutathione S-transferase family protein n=1 Tax=Parvibaculum sp. TaxID=2024848 RepID=UPI000C522A0E|nr:glutathione S-transferase [Parvibaculum sp.]MAU59714.1 glutathione S-transferase [Parvibaculum sp.]HAC60011.1 glutathione S-transferase [Rhodobiaceae bacterium]|tara:strand:- start:3920 stop:4546 length:627 start_codon:yes stop_codon:yes gene_type:complete
MIKVHHLNNSRSQRILWLLEELGLDYEIVPYQRDATTNLAPESLKKIHPLGKSPVITDGDKTVAESGAIVEYLIRTYGRDKMMPDEDSPDFLSHLHWMHYAEGSAMLPVMLSLYTMRLGEAAAPLLPRIESEVKNHFGYMNEALGERPFFVGSALTGADIQLTFTLEAAKSLGHLKDFANLERYLNEMHARPAYKRAEERGGRYDLGK